MEKIKQISIHQMKHKKPVTINDFGHYLAGLIDGDGCFIYKQCVIVFNYYDASSAYYIKKYLGFGNITKIPSKNAIKLIISKKEGLEKIINLINGKLRVPFKIESIKKNIIPAYKTIFYLEKELCLNDSTDLNNYWFAGFADADASFQIKIINRKTRKNPEIRLNFQIDQKKNDLLNLIKKEFGGNIGYRKPQDTFYYGSTSFGSARNFINYFDHYHLLSSKYLNYYFWRKAYIIIQNNEHVTNEGLFKIIQLKNKMNRNLELQKYNNIF